MICVLERSNWPLCSEGVFHGINGTFEHIFSVSAILDNALLHQPSLAMTFINLKNSFGSVSHSYIDDILEHISLPVKFSSYMSSLYSEIVGFIETKEWKTALFQLAGGRGFQGDTCHLLSSWWPLTPSSKALNVHHLVGSVYSISQKGVPLYISFGVNLN